MLAATKKFELFGNSARAQEEVAKFETNFIRIQAELGELEKCIETGSKHNLASIREHLDNVNTHMKVLQDQVKNYLLNSKYQFLY